MRRAWLPPDQRSVVFRRGDVVIRDASPWSRSVHLLLRHLEDEGFEGAPKVIGSSFDDDGREAVQFIEGEFMHPGPWTRDGAHDLGVMIRKLHRAVSTFEPPAGTEWSPWFGRDIGESSTRIISHCDLAPWNIVTRNGRPIALIDWEYTGPVEPLVELAQACWLNAKLHDDQVADREGLPDASERAMHLKAILDGYELRAKDRNGFVDRMVRFAVCDAAEQADEAEVTSDTKDPEALWGMAWRARAGAWMVRNRLMLEQAILT